MPRYSVTVTVRLDADSETEAEERVKLTLVYGNGTKGGFVEDFFEATVEDVENEDERGED